MENSTYRHFPFICFLFPSELAKFTSFLFVSQLYFLAFWIRKKYSVVTGLCRIWTYVCINDE